MLQIELTEGDCVNGSAGCKMGEAVAGSLGPGEIRARSLRPAHQLMLHMLGLATSITRRGLTLWSWLSGETCPLQGSQIDPIKAENCRGPFFHCRD